MRKSNFIVPIVALLSIGGFLATDMYVPSFPALMRHFQVSVGCIQLSMSLFIAGFGLSQFLSGLYSDRFGRKPVLMAGLAIYLLGSLFTLFPSSINYLYVGRLLQGLGIGAGTALSRVILRDCYIGETLTKKFAIIAPLAVLTPAATPFFGGFLQDYFGYVGNFVVMMLSGIALLLVISFIYKETHLNKVKTATQPSYLYGKFKLFLSNPGFIFMMLTNGAAFSIVIAYSMISPFIFQVHFGFSASAYGTILLLISLGLVTGMILNRLLLHVIKSDLIIVVGLVIMMLSSTVLVISSSFSLVDTLSLGINIFVLDIGVAMILPNIAAKVFGFFSDGVGLVGAFYGFFRTLVCAVVGFFISSLHIAHIQSLSWLLLGMSGLTVLCFALSYFKFGRSNTSSCLVGVAKPALG